MASDSGCQDYMLEFALGLFCLSRDPFCLQREPFCFPDVRFIKGSGVYELKPKEGLEEPLNPKP